MLEVYKKPNGEYKNKSIKVNDLGMNQSIKFTVEGVHEGQSKFGLVDKDKKPIMVNGVEYKAKYFRVHGTYHKKTGDEEGVSMWFNESKVDTVPNHVKDFIKNEGKTVTIKKTKKEGAKFHYYEVKEINTQSSPETLTEFEQQVIDTFKANPDASEDDLRTALSSQIKDEDRINFVIGKVK